MKSIAYSPAVVSKFTAIPEEEFMSFHEVTLGQPVQSRQLAANPNPLAEIQAAMPRAEDQKIASSQRCPKCGATALELKSKGTRDTPARVILHARCTSCGADVDIIV
jgi:hypothetical protein